MAALSQDHREVPIQTCLSAFEHREAIFVYDATKTISGGSGSTKIVLLLERQGRLDAGYYWLVNQFYADKFITFCRLRPLN